MGVGRQAAGGQPRDRRPRPRVRAAGSPRGRDGRRRRVPRAGCSRPRRCATSTSGTPTSRWAQLLEQLGSEATAKQRKKVEQNLAKARTKDSMQAFAKLTHEVDGERRIIGDPPLIVPIEDVLPHGTEREATEEALRSLIRSYRRTLETDRRHLLEDFRLRPRRPQGRRRRQRRAPGPGSCCCSAGTTRTRCSCRPRRPRSRSSSVSSGRAATRTPASAWSPDSG